MKLDRNINPNGMGKYALLKLRGAVNQPSGIIYDAVQELSAKTGMEVDFGNDGSGDFMVIRLRDKYCAPALFAYSEAARKDGEYEWADEIRELAVKAEQFRRIAGATKKPD